MSCDPYFWLGLSVFGVPVLLALLGGGVLLWRGARAQRRDEAHAQKLARCLTDGREKP